MLNRFYKYYPLLVSPTGEAPARAVNTSEGFLMESFKLNKKETKRLILEARKNNFSVFLMLMNK
jgi:hypothetical protein